MTAVGPGVCLEVLRLKSGLSIAATARRARLSRRFIRTILRGEVDPGGARLGHISSVLADALVAKATES